MPHRDRSRPNRPAPLIGLLVLAALTACDAPADSAAADSRIGDARSGGLAVQVGPASRVQPDRRVEPRTGDMPDTLRRVQEAMAGLDCSRLQLVHRSRSGVAELRGHVPTEELATDIVTASQRLAGGDIRIIGNLMVLPPPICEVLEIVEAMGLPQSTAQWNDPLAVGGQAEPETPRAVSGDIAHFRFQAPAYASYLYVDYFDSDGGVVHLTPSQFQTPVRFDAGSALQIGGAESVPRYFFAPPLGVDLVLVIATSEPIFGGYRPYHEDGRGYLAWLQGRVQALRQDHPDARGEWAFMLMRVEDG